VTTLFLRVDFVNVRRHRHGQLGQRRMAPRVQVGVSGKNHARRSVAITKHTASRVQNMRSMRAGSKHLLAYR
jgi:hypothetical protein